MIVFEDYEIGQHRLEAAIPRHKSNPVAAMEELNAKLMADPKYMKLLSTGKELFIAGSLNDTIWRTA